MISFLFLLCFIVCAIAPPPQPCGPATSNFLFDELHPAGCRCPGDTLDCQEGFWSNNEVRSLPRPSHFWLLDETLPNVRNSIVTNSTGSWSTNTTHVLTSFGTSDKRYVSFTNTTTSGKRPFLTLNPPLTFGTRNFSIEFWFVWDEPSPKFRQFLVGNRGTCSGGKFFHLMLNTDAFIALEVNGGGGIFTASGRRFNDSQWHFVQMFRYLSFYTLLVDGQLELMQNATAVVDHSSGNPLQFGTYSCSSVAQDATFSGGVADLAVYFDVPGPSFPLCAIQGLTVVARPPPPFVPFNMPMCPPGPRSLCIARGKPCCGIAGGCGNVDCPVNYNQCGMPPTSITPSTTSRTTGSTNSTMTSNSSSTTNANATTVSTSSVKATMSSTTSAAAATTTMTLITTQTPTTTTSTAMNNDTPTPIPTPTTTSVQELTMSDTKFNQRTEPHMGDFVSENWWIFIVIGIAVVAILIVVVGCVVARRSKSSAMRAADNRRESREMATARMEDSNYAPVPDNFASSSAGSAVSGSAGSVGSAFGYAPAPSRLSVAPTVQPEYNAPPNAVTYSPPPSALQ